LRLENAVKGKTGRLLWDLTYNILKRLPLIHAGERRRMLHRVAVANISFLDEMSLEAKRFERPKLATAC
jgi:hypothetical protein